MILDANAPVCDANVVVLDANVGVAHRKHPMKINKNKSLGQLKKETDSFVYRNRIGNNTKTAKRAFYLVSYTDKKREKLSPNTQKLKVAKQVPNLHQFQTRFLMNP